MFVQDFPAGGRKHQVSQDGRGDARWGPDGLELFFVSPTGVLMAVSFQRATGKTGGPAKLFDIVSPNPTARRGRYVPLPDGQFLVISPTRSSAADAPLKILTDFVPLLSN